MPQRSKAVSEQLWRHEFRCVMMPVSLRRLPRGEKLSSTPAVLEQCGYKAEIYGSSAVAQTSLRHTRYETRRIAAERVGGWFCVGGANCGHRQAGRPSATLAESPDRRAAPAVSPQTGKPSSVLRDR